MNSVEENNFLQPKKRVILRDEKKLLQNFVRLKRKMGIVKTFGAAYTI